MLAQHFAFRPQGAVKSGTASYSLDPATGKVTYQAHLVVGFLFVTKVIEEPPAEYDVDPALLKSAALDAVGKKVAVGKVTFTVIELGNGHAKVSITIDGNPNITGTAIVETTGEYLAIDQVLAVDTVPVFGKVTLEADALAGGLFRKDYVAKKSDWRRLDEWRREQMSAWYRRLLCNR